MILATVLDGRYFLAFWSITLVTIFLWRWCRSN